jgi:hypothetical protein
VQPIWRKWSSYPELRYMPAKEVERWRTVYQKRTGAPQFSARRAAQIAANRKVLLKALDAAGARIIFRHGRAAGVQRARVLCAPRTACDGRPRGHDALCRPEVSDGDDGDTCTPKIVSALSRLAAAPT